ncbi:MAG: hypothetical protein V9G11_08890 [Bifidobacterium adolescentis]
MDVAYAPIAQTILVDKRHEQGFAAKVSAIDPTRHDAARLAVRRYRRAIRFRQQRGLDVVEAAVSRRIRRSSDG